MANVAVAGAPFGEIPKLDLEFVFQIRIYFEERRRFETPLGTRVYIPVIRGDLSGPRLNGKVLPRSGGEYAENHRINAHYMLETDDGTPIYIRNSGYVYRTDGIEMQLDNLPWRGEQPYYLRCTPQFDCPVGPHDWLTRTVLVGTGQRHVDPDFTVFTYYAVL